MYGSGAIVQTCSDWLAASTACHSCSQRACAATQTTAAVLTWTLYCLAQHPEHVATLHAEVPLLMENLFLQLVLSEDIAGKAAASPLHRRNSGPPMCASCCHP